MPNKQALCAAVESTVAFHGLGSHVSVQLANVLAPHVVALEVLPRRLRLEIETHLSSAPQEEEVQVGRPRPIRRAYRKRS